MKINNGSFIVRYNIMQFVTLLIYATIMAVIIFTATFEILLKNVDKIIIAIVISFAYLVFLIYNYIADYNYISFSDEGSKFIFHYVSSRPLNKKRNAIEIPKSKIDGYTINKTFLGRKKEITILVKTQNGVAKYPPINISALSKNQIFYLTKSLKQDAE